MPYLKNSPNSGDRKKQNRESQRRAREKDPRRMRNNDLRSRYGITIEQYDKMIVDQGYKCALCLDVLRAPHVDHDHRTGKVRGLLCGPCNLRLGSYEAMMDNPLLASYLERGHG